MDHSPVRSRALTALLAVVVVVVTGALRLATFEIGNDDYLHLSVAQQLLLGDVPVRDFIDPGRSEEHTSELQSH